MRPRGDGGSALLLVLWLTLALSLLVSVFAYAANQQIQIVSWRKKRDQADSLAAAAIEYLPKLLQDQRLEASRMNDPERPRFDPAKFTGEWRSEPVEMAGGKFHLLIHDVEQKLNVNLAPRAVWENLLKMTSVSEEDAQTWLDSLEDWTDSNDAFKINGAEDQYYSSLSPAYQAKNAPVTNLGEIFWIRKGPEILAARLDPDRAGMAGRLVDLLTVEGDGKINVNTAPPALLAALGNVDAATAQDWSRRRSGPDGVSGTQDDLPVASAFEGMDESARAMLTTRSGYFIVEGIGESQGVQAVRRALFRAEGGTLKKVRDLGEPIT